MKGYKMRQVVLLVLFFSLPLFAIKPANPTNFQWSVTAHSATISWQDNDNNEQGFKIYRDGKLIYITKEGVTHYVDRGLKANTSYRYTVKATDIARYKLLPPKNNQKLYFGAEPGYAEDTTNVKLIGEKIEEFDRNAGKQTMWAYLSDNWTNWASRGSFPYPKAQIDAILNKQKKVVFLRMIPYKSKYSVSPIETVAEAEACFSNKNCVKETYSLDDIANNRSVQAKLRAWAIGAKEHFQEQKNRGKAFYLMIDFAPEMNGYWFPWGGAHQAPDKYIAAYRKVVEIFREVKVPHVTWVFHPSLPNQDDWWWYHESKENNGSGLKGSDIWATPANYYPGDEYVDWIGFSRYGIDEVVPPRVTSYPSFAEKMNKFYLITDISPTKPLMVAEFAVAESSFASRVKSLWIKGAFDVIFSQPRIRAFSYWNENWDADINMQIESSTKSLQAFKTGVANSKVINQPRISYEGR